LKLKNNEEYREEAIILESIFVDARILDSLIRILRSLNYKVESFKIEMIKEGLIEILNKMIE
jgi:hypothetical protein